MALSSVVLVDKGMNPDDYRQSQSASDYGWGKKFCQALSLHDAVAEGFMYPDEALAGYVEGEIGSTALCMSISPIYTEEITVR